MNTLQLIIVWWTSLAIGGILLARAAANSSSNPLIAAIALIAAVAVYSLRPHPAANKRRVLYAVLGPLAAYAVAGSVTLAIQVYRFRKCEDRKETAARDATEKLKLDVRVNVLGSYAGTQSTRPASTIILDRTGRQVGVRVHGGRRVTLAGTVVNESFYEIDGGLDLAVLPPADVRARGERAVPLMIRVRPGERIEIFHDITDRLELSDEEAGLLKGSSQQWRFRVTRVWGLVDVCR